MVLPGTKRASTLKGPFDVLAEGPSLEEIRGGETALELFRAGLKGLNATIYANLEQQATLRLL
jgi:hypothetical protein